MERNLLISLTACVQDCGRPRLAAARWNLTTYYLTQILIFQCEHPEDDGQDQTGGRIARMRSNNPVLIITPKVNERKAVIAMKAWPPRALTMA